MTMFSTPNLYKKLVSSYTKRTKPRLRQKKGIWYCISLSGKGTVYSSGATPSEAWDRYQYISLFPFSL